MTADPSTTPAARPTTSSAPARLIDARGPRFAAWLTSAVLATVLLTAPLGVLPAVLLAAQALVFATGAFIGLRVAPYPALFRLAVAPRLGPPTEREDPAPVRFAQGLGFGFATLGLLGFALGATWLALAATGAALVAALLNAAFGLCLGCQLYLRLPAALRPTAPQT
jgi:hypothetical protein